MMERKIVIIPADDTPYLAPQQHLRVAAYCRVSTKQEAQESSLALQIAHFNKMIGKNPKWIHAGVYAEQVSGLKRKNRPEFQKMIRKCRQGKIDLILMKSISRFGRNTVDIISSLRELHRLGIDVYFETQELWLHQIGEKSEIIFTVLSAFSQKESEEMSRNIKWGIQYGFQTGTSGYADFVCYGYRQDEFGNLAIHEGEAEIVRCIFQMRVAGCSLVRITDWLFENEIPSPRGQSRWSREAVSRLLKNEKYVGDVLLQKTHVPDMFSGKQMKNAGAKAMFMISEHHPAIITKECFQLVNGSYYF